MPQCTLTYKAKDELRLSLSVESEATLVVLELKTNHES